MTSGIRVYANHIRQAKLCSRGARQWFGLHGLDWNQFITRGIAVEDIEALNDAFGNQVAAHARAEAAGEDDDE